MNKGLRIIFCQKYRKYKDRKIHKQNKLIAYTKVQFLIFYSHNHLYIVL